MMWAGMILQIAQEPEFHMAPPCIQFSGNILPHKLLSPNKNLQRFSLFEPQHFMNESVWSGANNWISLKHIFLINKEDLSTFQGFDGIKLHNSLPYHCAYLRSNSYDLPAFLSIPIAPISNHSCLFCFQPFWPQWHPGNWSFLNANHFIVHSSPMTLRFCVYVDEINGWWLWGSVSTWMS